MGKSEDIAEGQPSQEAKLLCHLVVHSAQRETGLEIQIQINSWLVANVWVELPRNEKDTLVKDLKEAYGQTFQNDRGLRYFGM